jgi:hypothetical protein
LFPVSEQGTDFRLSATRFRLFTSEQNRGVKLEPPSSSAGSARRSVAHPQTTFDIPAFDGDDFQKLPLHLQQDQPCARLLARVCLFTRNKLRIYSITSSARISSEDGTVRPSALAVFMLITSSNLVGLSTGRSEGFVPNSHSLGTAE